MSDASEGDALITAEVREKIAKTIYDFDRRHSAIVPWEENYESAKKRWREYADAALSVLPALIRQVREDERERAAKIADDVAERKNAAQTEAHESRNEFAVGLFQVSESTARAIAAAIRSTEPTP